MKFIRNISHTVKRELFYQWHSKMILAVFLVILTLCMLHLYGLHNSVLSMYDRYTKTEQSYKEQGIDIVKALGEVNRVYVEGNTKVVSNPIKEDFIELSVSIRNLEPQNVIPNTLEFVVFVFCTLAFGIYASYVASYDFKYKTHKFISIRSNQKEILLGKLLSIIIVMALTLAAALIVTFTGSFLVKSIVAGKVPVENFSIELFNYENGLLPQLVLVFFVLLFYIIVGFSVGFILKGMVIPSIGLLLYGLLIPILGKYDFRNIFSYFSHGVFSFNARFVMFTPIPINETAGISILAATQVILLLVLLQTADRRSAYK
jgi:hypothetical protein